MGVVLQRNKQKARYAELLDGRARAHILWVVDIESASLLVQRSDLGDLFLFIALTRHPTRTLTMKPSNSTSVTHEVGSTFSALERLMGCTCCVPGVSHAFILSFKE
jgi:hypothetical protein